MLDRINDYIPVVRDQLNPFVVPQEMFLTARRYRKQGYYREAVIFAQTEIESLLARLYDQFRILEGRSLAEAQQERKDLAFLKMVKSKFAPWLGGQWNPRDSATLCGQWYQHTYELRNRVAHAGYFPTLTETTTALEAADNFAQYVLSLIRNNQRRYPDIAKYFFEHTP